MQKKRQDAIHAFHILNYFVGDLFAASRVRQLFQSPGIANITLPVTCGTINRMCLSYLFLTLAKWKEFYDRFNSVIPDDCCGDCKNLCKEIRLLKIKKFRNTFVSHIWDNDENRPLTDPEIAAAVNTIVKNDPDAFSAWCNNPGNNVFPRTVVSIVEHTRNRIRDEFKLTENELFPRR